MNDMKKTFQREMKGSGSPEDANGFPEPSSFSPTQSSRASAEPEMLPSSSSETTNVVTMTEVNFKYLKHVIFKFFTSPEYEVSQCCWMAAISENKSIDFCRPNTWPEQFRCSWSSRRTKSASFRNTWIGKCPGSDRSPSWEAANFPFQSNPLSTMFRTFTFCDQSISKFRFYYSDARRRYETLVAIKSCTFVAIKSFYFKYNFCVVKFPSSVLSYVLRLSSSLSRPIDLVILKLTGHQCEHISHN